ncbi:MAG: protein kinase [Myxococcales bacterium]|nr:protein kinase [Myxococcales bacterium]
MGLKNEREDSGREGEGAVLPPPPSVASAGLRSVGGGSDDDAARARGSATSGPAKAKIVGKTDGPLEPPVIAKIKSPAEMWASSRAKDEAEAPEGAKAEAPKLPEPPKVEAPKAEAPKAEAPKAETAEGPAAMPLPKVPEVPAKPASSMRAPQERGSSEISGTTQARPLDPEVYGAGPIAKPPRAGMRGRAKRSIPAPPAIGGPKPGKPRPLKDITRTRVRLTDHGLHDPQSIDADSTGVQVLEQVRLEPGELVTSTRYRIVGWLGEGGMGVVYECEHVDIERRVALKVLRTGVDPNSRRAKMFREEARAVSRAGRSEDGQVSNIVEIYDFGELPDGRMWFAMELLHGRSLARMLSEGPMDPARLIGVLRQLCKGLGAAHDANVIHRDIKPGNVMLVRDRGRDDVVKVVDFGVAAVLAEGDSGEVQLEGTPNYMAPEQATGDRFDHRLDIYAVGAVGFHMLAGGPPFQGDDVFQLLRKVCTEAPPRPSELNPEGGIPTALEDVILKCLAKDPDDRYEDMRDLEAALCEAQIAARLVTAWDDLPLPVVEPPARYEALQRNMPKASAPSRPRRTWALAVAAAVAFGLAGWGIVRASQGDEAAQVDDRIASHVAAARDAAARALYLYPPPGEPEARTAYVEVVDLEAMANEVGVSAIEAGKALRGEFAGTLVRLGDRYWDRPGGRPFAVDYYIAALVFDPSQERARERAPITPGALAELQRKASSLDFEAAELSASEPLLALAEDDEQERVRKLEELGNKEDEHGVQAELRIQKLLEDEGVEATEVAAAKPRKPSPRKESSSRDAASSSDAVGSDDAPVKVREAKRASELVTQGLAALRSGKRDRAETLFHRALDQDHRSHQALDGLAQVQFARGRYQEAVQYGKRAVGIAPNRGSYRIHLGDAYFKVFRYQEARAEYRKADELGNPDAKARLQKVKSKLGR